MWDGASSRTSAAGAGWEDGGGPAAYRALLERRRHWRRPLSWLRPATLMEAFNDVLAKRVSDVVDEERVRWVQAQRAAGAEARCPGWIVDRSDLSEPAFVVLGDPGEGDGSQYAVVPPLLARSADTDFMVVCSDVVYPAGDVNDYVDKHYIPYQDYPAPIFALPGNHDWYDLLDGFMLAFCGAEPPARPRYRVWSYTPAEWLARVLWRRSSLPRRAELHEFAARRPATGQPGPYYAIDTGPLRIVCVDTGITGGLDREQGAWLRRVSAGPKPKLLLTGKPLIVDNRREPCPIRWTEPPRRRWFGRPEPMKGQQRDVPMDALSVDQIVLDPRHNYVAAIGGDIHNYQRYPVATADGREIQYIVAGGGGAFMHATHRIDPRRVPAMPPSATFPAEERIRLYPLRGDSLAFYARRIVPPLRKALLAVLVLLAVLAVLAVVVGRWDDGAAVAVHLVVLAVAAAAGALALRLRRDLRTGEVDPDVCSRFLARVYEQEATVRAGGRDVALDAATERLLGLCTPLAPGGGPLASLLSELLDSDEPPFFKQFLRLEVRDGELRIACIAATGRAEHESDPPVEDEVRIPLVSR